jgi:hypothetical protein
MSKYDEWKGIHDKANQEAKEASEIFFQSVMRHSPDWCTWEKYKALTKKVRHAWGVMMRCKPV